MTWVLSGVEPIVADAAPDATGYSSASSQFKSVGYKDDARRGDDTFKLDGLIGDPHQVTTPGLSITTPISMVTNTLVPLILGV